MIRKFMAEEENAVHDEAKESAKGARKRRKTENSQVSACEMFQGKNETT